MEITAAVARGPDVPFTLERLTLAAPGAGEVVVRMAASGICHSDLTAKRNFPAGVPIVLGHEGAGVVEEVGPEVEGVRVGDHVLVTYASCGGCTRCRTGTPGYCDQWATLNAGRFGAESPLAQDGQPVVGAFFGQSSFATHIVTTPRNLIVVGDDVDLAMTAAFGCGIQTGAGAVANVLRPEPDSSVVIFGVGGVGMAAVMAARALGVGRLIAVDLSAARLEVAGELGADVLVDGAADEVAAQVVSATGGGATHALDTTGIAGVVASAVDALAPLGVLALVALGEATLPIEVAKLIGQGKTLRGSIEGDGDPQRFVPRLVDWYRRGEFPMEKIVMTYPFGAINDAVAAAHSGAVVKPVLTFPFVE
ncbi:aryl-alcohol dehydrogenase [Nocardia transvalensis]|uniref:Aryl-alcohol dehydrogenase n=1 Tax=Nocardia transvalensis TaxID=37333 RepID=A0A7W9UKH9_9NOCA|nr:NAD(P)-dependent alcohol dehydrogenase [Nocardia transvalensis]MBB5916578.1 aryl-alcohol dehydrogenase [Nocardia transvalensis]